MAALDWDSAGKRTYECGIEHGIVKIRGGATQEAWVGLTSVSASPSGAETTKLWADNREYGMTISREEFGGSIEAYTYPPCFVKAMGIVESIGSKINIPMQKRESFDFSYISREYDADNNEVEHVHFIWNARVTPSERSYSTINESPEAISLSWSFTTTPETSDIGGVKYNTSHASVTDKTIVPKLKAYLADDANPWPDNVGALHGIIEGL